MLEFFLSNFNQEKKKKRERRKRRGKEKNTTTTTNNSNSVHIDQSYTIIVIKSLSASESPCVNKALSLLKTQQEKTQTPSRCLQNSSFSEWRGRIIRLGVWITRSLPQRSLNCSVNFTLDCTFVIGWGSDSETWSLDQARLGVWIRRSLPWGIHNCQVYYAWLHLTACVCCWLRFAGFISLHGQFCINFLPIFVSMKAVQNRWGKIGHVNGLLTSLRLSQFSIIQSSFSISLSTWQ